MVGPTVDEWLSAGERFSHQGHSIFYRRQGAGENALLLIHGFPTASWDWSPLWEPLGKLASRLGLQLIAPDMLGFGFSDKPASHRYSLLEQADLHQALLQQLGVSCIHVLAHDYGVSVAQELLAREREGKVKLLSVALLNGGLFPETHRPLLIQKALLSRWGPLVSRLINEKRFSSSFLKIFGPRSKPSQAELHEFWRLVDYHQGARILHRLIRYIPERREQRERWVGALQATKVPLRLINGPEDPISGAHMVVRYRELVPHPDVVSLAGVGHYPQVEAPAEVLHAVQEFLMRKS